MEEHRLETQGLCRFVRHPGYTGKIILDTGYIMYFFSLGGVTSACLSSPRAHLFTTILVKSISLM